MEKRKDNYKLKKTLYSFGIASVLLMTGCNSRYDSQESSISQSSIEINDVIENQEVKIRIAVASDEELLNTLKELENDLPNIITNYRVTGLEISASLDGQSIEAIELIKNIAISCPDLMSLSIPKLYMEDKDLIWISSLTNLTNLDINANFYVTDISFVEALPNLETLNISNTHVEDISSLTNLTNLKRLDMACTLISNCSIIDDLPPSLTSLNIFNFRNLSDCYTSRGHYDSREAIEELIVLIKEDEKGYRLIFN